mgnify:CR=1 FL=1
MFSLPAFAPWFFIDRLTPVGFYRFIVLAQLRHSLLQRLPGVYQVTGTGLLSVLGQLLFQIILIQMQFYTEFGLDQASALMHQS